MMRGRTIIVISQLARTGILLVITLSRKNETANNRTSSTGNMLQSVIKKGEAHGKSLPFSIAIYLIVRDLHVSNNVVDQVVEVWADEVVKRGFLSDACNQLKHVHN